jgi:hypothetical protein
MEKKMAVDVYGRNQDMLEAALNIQTSKTSRPTGFTMVVNSAENGYILNVNNKTYIYKDVKTLAKAIPGILVSQRLIGNS